MATVVVIGAGVGGLATAARLAGQGHAVTVVEQAGTVGGKLGRFERAGFRFDTGPSLVTMPQLFTDLDLDLVPLDPIVRHHFPDGSMLDSTSDATELATRWRALTGAGDWERLWKRAERIWDTSWKHVLTSSVDSPLRIARLAWRLRDLAAVAPGRTLSGLCRGLDPRLRMFLERYATYTGADPRRAPAALLAVPYAELHYGGWYIRGGLGTLADALLERCKSLGVRVELGTAVSAITVAGSAVSGVLLASGRGIAADVVVAGADALHVYRDLLPTPARARKLTARSLGGFVLLLGLRGRTPGQAHHTVYFPAHYHAEFDAIFGDPATPAPDPAIFVTSADDPTVHPDGHEAWFVLVNAAPQGPVDWRTPGLDWRTPGLAAGYADRVLEVLAHRGVDVRDRIVFREIRTPADLETATLTPGGAIYGTPSHGLAGLLRPPNRGPVRGLFLVGGSVHPGGGLPLVMLSAQLVSAQIGPA